MLILSGKNLGERHKELNAKVNEAVLNNVNFEAVKNSAEQSDVDKLYKIDLASKYKNIDYILEIVKSGDTLYISRALKCTWMFEDKFSNFINADYLHHNVFPSMSLKMKKKLLTTISIHVRSADRAIAFCDYCMNIKLRNVAVKFVIYTTENYKLQFIKNSDLANSLTNKNDFKDFIGDSFALADAFLAKVCWIHDKLKAFSTIGYLYSIAHDKYLDMLEKHCGFENYSWRKEQRLGLRVSKKILTQHKERVVMKPRVYVNCVNKTSLVKYSTVEDAKMYVKSLLPADVKQFWDENFYDSYEHIINIIPAEDRFGFIKQTFCDKYPDQSFEMNLKFYSLKYYRFMSSEQKNKWALDQIASNNEILGIGNDYFWYKFVNFEKAFGDLKKLIMITPDKGKRLEIIEILIDSSKTQRDLEMLFNYYHDRHNNENRFTKERFLDTVTCRHNVYEFDKDCWDAFNKILQNLGVYSRLEEKSCRKDLKFIAFTYHVINRMDVHEALIEFIDDHMSFHRLKRRHVAELSKEKQELIYQYLFKFYMDKIKEFDFVPYEDEKFKICKYVTCILDLMHTYGKTKNHIPEVVTKYIKLDWKEFKSHSLFYEPVKRITQQDLIRLLKTDSRLVVENLLLVKQNIDIPFRYHLGQLLRKLKVYFPNDVSKAYLNFYNEILAGSSVSFSWALAACYGIFNLAEVNYKVDFMTKFAPTQTKINRSEIDETLLHVQQAICATAFYSRPPIPLKTILLYVKGDYLPSCLPMFNYYSANLPLPLCMEFIEAILNNPVSIQKHGIRLAFRYFNTDNLKILVVNTWKRTRNVSIRLVIYKALFNKILKEDENAQNTLFEILRTITLGLLEDDSTDVFDLWKSNKIPRHLISDYMNALWIAVSGLPDKKTNRMRMVDILKYMNSNPHIIRNEILRDIAEEFVKNTFSTENSVKSSLKETDFNQSKWDLTATYITYVPNKEDVESKLQLVKEILTQCSVAFNLIDDNNYIVRKFCTDIVAKLLNLNLVEVFEPEVYHNQIMIFEPLLNMLQDLFVIEDTYMTIWVIRMNVAMRKALAEIIANHSDAKDESENGAVIKEFVLKFGNDIGMLIKEYVETDMYFNVFDSKIQSNFIWITKELRYLILFGVPL